MITRQDLLNLREQLQEDLLCILDETLDGEHFQTDICQAVVNRLKPLLEKTPKN
jgi:hypothetical protein